MTLAGGVYTCTGGVPTGATTLKVNVHFPKVGSAIGCWAYNKSSDVPCGGNGSFLGTLIITKGGTLVTAVPVDNGVCLTPLLDPATCTKYYFNLDVGPVP